MRCVWIKLIVGFVLLSVCLILSQFILWCFKISLFLRTAMKKMQQYEIWGSRNGVMNGSDITSCSPLEVNQRSGGSCRLHIHGLRRSQASSKLSLLSLASFFFTIWPWRCRFHVTPKLRLAFNGLHDVISKKTEPKSNKIKRWEYSLLAYADDSNLLDKTWMPHSVASSNHDLKETVDTRLWSCLVIRLEKYLLMLHKRYHSY